MTLFEVEQEVWSVEGLRIAFIPPMDSVTEYYSYKERYPSALPGGSAITDLEDRLMSIVGPGIRFVLLSGVSQAIMLNSIDPDTLIH